MDEKAVLRASKALTRHAEPLHRLVTADVQHQRTDALLLNTTAAAEFLTPPAESLLPHQRHGVRWLLAMHRLGHSAVVADEMGLGKTVQVLAFFSALALRGCFGTFLVVVPLATLENWAAEAAKWLPWMHTTVFRGDSRVRTRLRASLRRRHRAAFANAEKLREVWLGPGPAADRATAVGRTLGGLVLASYEMVLADRGALARLLPWDVVTVDEAQRLKRADGRLIQQLRKCPAAGMRLMLSGTPVQNSARELWSLMEFVAPGLFTGSDGGGRDGGNDGTAAVHAALDTWMLEKGRRDRRRKQARSDRENSNCGSGGVARVEDADASGDDDNHASDPFMTEVIGHLHCALLPFVLRRTKHSAGLALQPKLQVIVPTPLTAAQAAVYRAVEESPAFANNRLMHLRRCCLYPAFALELLQHSTTADTSNSAHTAACAVALDKAQAVLSGRDPFIGLSGKLRALSQMLPLLEAQGHRVLLFSQFTTALDVIEDFLAANLPALTYLRLDGATAAEDRRLSTAQFKSAAVATPPQLIHGGGGGGASRSGRFAGNAENGVVEDNNVFDTPPPRHSRRPRLEEATAASLLSSLPFDLSHGTGVPVAAKQAPGAFLFLISTRTGGVGLNLTGADTVVLFDGDFNPHNDRQAVDRCHRIGQTRPVAVYRLVCPASVEESLLAVARRKLELEGAVLRNSTNGNRCAPGMMKVSVCGEADGDVENVFVVAPGSGKCRGAAAATATVLRPLTASDREEEEGSTSKAELSSDVMAKVLDRSWLVEQLAAIIGSCR